MDRGPSSNTRALFPPPYRDSPGTQKVVIQLMDSSNKHGLNIHVGPGKTHKADTVSALRNKARDPSCQEVARKPS